MLVKKQINPGLRILAHECEAEGFKSFAYEYCFHPLRKFRFDLCWPKLKVAFEREGFGQGGTAGRHQRIKGYRSDIYKYNLAQILGWIVIRATAAEISNGAAWPICSPPWRPAVKHEPFRLRDPYGDVLELSVDGKGRYDCLRYVRVIMRESCCLLTVEDLLGLKNWIEELLGESQPARLKCGASRRQKFPDVKDISHDE